MARTIHGNLTGRAAVIARRDLNTEIFEAQREARRKFNADLSAALENLKELDPDGWEAWFDGRPEQTCGEMLPLCVARVAELRNEKDDALFDDVAETRRAAHFGTQL
ncbi:MAG: hypothetical protein Q7T18_05635 [Sedimentisphaerales bacterium]|nr:hypothetical protein [Sedimentisphaerales bacterium]